ncbi:MAG: PAS-domain containing protein [Paracoccaceae bacterium]|nr:PAS-domain containing protein [Paracoccaceae bacterium]
MPEIGTLLVVVAAAFAASAVALLAATALAARRWHNSGAARLLAETRAPIAFLFDDETVQDATPAAYAFLETSAESGSDWTRLAGLLRHRFPGLDGALRGLAEAGRIELAATDGGADRLSAEWRDGLARIALVDGAADAAADDGSRVERQSLAATEAEVEALRNVVQAGPAAIWKQGTDGTVLWANDVYFALAYEMLGTERAHSWPPPPLFPVAGGAASEAGIAPAPFRARLGGDDGKVSRWFECQGYASGEEMLCYALPADSLVRAEESLREFVQTLSKTFAQLPIGLAIFDRARRLALFNPALTDLTGLEVEFLAARPTLFAFLDRLRERRRIPEPRDYRSWRQRMVDLEAAAAGGFVQENWTLPTGQTFRVSGRPHPDGAVAFLFEDITAEISLTRRFRSEIELGQTVIDSLEEAIAVFSAAGVLTFSNAAYAALWGIDPSVTLAEIGIVEATRLWQSRTEPTPIWGDARDFLAERGERAEWSGRVKLSDGRGLDCRFQPLSGGATLVGFSETTRQVSAQVSGPALRARSRARA